MGKIDQIEIMKNDLKHIKSDLIKIKKGIETLTDKRIENLEAQVKELRENPGIKAISTIEKIKFLIISLLITAVISWGIKVVQNTTLHINDDRRKSFIEGGV